MRWKDVFFLFKMWGFLKSSADQIQAGFFDLVSVFSARRTGEFRFPRESKSA